jgi:hypothetical protein
MKGIKTSKGYWSGDAGHFVRKNNEVKANLEREGCRITEYHDGTQRLIIIDVTELLGKPKTDLRINGDSLWNEVIKSAKEK